MKLSTNGFFRSLLITGICWTVIADNSRASVIMKSDMPGAYYSREMLSKGTYKCKVNDSVFTVFDRDKPVIEKSPIEPNTSLTVMYEISRLPKELQSKTDWNYSKERKVSHILVEGMRIDSHYWTDRGTTENAGRIALQLNEDELTLGHGPYGFSSSFYLALDRVYKEDWQGYAVKPIGDGLLNLLLTCKRQIIVGK